MAFERWIPDGYPCFLAFGRGAVKVSPKTITPMGGDARGPIDVASMRSVVWRQKFPKRVAQLTEVMVNAAYLTDGVYSDLADMLAIIQQITITFADGSSIVFWGFIDKIKPGTMEEGKQPTVDLTIVPTGGLDNTLSLGVSFTPIIV